MCVVCAHITIRIKAYRFSLSIFFLVFVETAKANIVTKQCMMDWTNVEMNSNMIETIERIGQHQPFGSNVHTFAWRVLCAQNQRVHSVILI